MNADSLRCVQVYTKVVDFCADRRDEIKAGFKNRIHRDHAMTGKEFCTLSAIDYDSIVDARAPNRKENSRSLVDELATIPELKEVTMRMELSTSIPNE